MSYKSTVYKVMIASPSDVTAERNIIKSVIAEWNVIHSEKTRIVLMPVGWETHISPEMGEPPQKYINKEILENCDLLVGVFWTRVGTATENYPSGSIEEIEKHIKAGKPAMLYFSRKPVEPDSIDKEQYEKLKEFMESCKNRGIYEVYNDFNDFKDKFNRQLQIKIINDKYFQVEEGEENNQMEFSTIANVPQLSREAQVLLKEASQDISGQILRIVFIGGLVFQTNGKAFGEQGGARESALWDGALNELERHNFIEPLGYKREVFKVTREGYEAADLITL